MKRIVILGSTGSIGKQTLDIIRNYSKELKFVGLACKAESSGIKNQIKEFTPEIFSIAEKGGEKAIIRAATWPKEG